jgi:phenylacetate-CoA ligase
MNSSRIIDFLSGKNVQQYYKLYQETQWYSPEEMDAFRLKKLQGLIDHCYHNVPFYNSFMIKNGIKPDDIKSLSDITIFPIITKETIKAHYSDFIPKNITKIKGVKGGQTGGTTGSVLFKRTDAATRSSTWAAYKRFYDWMGINESDKNILIKGGHISKQSIASKIKTNTIDYIKNVIRLDAYNSSEENADKLMTILSKHRVPLIRGYSQSLFELAKEIEKRNITFNVKAIMTTAEPLMPEYRVLISKVFNADVYDQYGCGEVGGIAFECSKHEGLHITEERVLLETNEKNELIITDLDNYVMPYIRYWNADEVEFSNCQCSCGRQSKMIKKILGRTSDYIYTTEGTGIHWGFIFHLLWDTKIALNRNLVKFQLVQKSFDKVLLRVVSDPLSESDKVEITNGIRAKMGHVVVDFIQENDIENSPSGKYRPVVSEIKVN